MNASHFLDLIKKGGPSNGAELTDLCQDYPYFALAQLARLKSKPELNVADTAFAALFKQDEWLFAQWYATQSFEPARSDSIVKETDTEVKSEGDKVVVTIEEVDEKEQQKEESVSEHRLEDILATSEHKEDILSLINELPNSNPLTEARQEQKDALLVTQESPVEISVDESEAKHDDPEKSLMVMMSFTDWLNYFKTKKQKEEDEEKDKKALKTHWQKEKLAAAVEEDVDEIPEPIFKQAMDSISSESGIISESLAKILASQGKIDRAIDMYKKLSLRNPEKRSYFADLIENLNSKRDE